MRLILLLLHVWGSLHTSLSHNATCSQPPDVNHAQVSEDTQKDEYYEGDLVYFTCETGYISGPTIRYRCTARGWEAIHRGSCYLKPCVLPEETPNGYYQIIEGEEFVFGTVIKYFCNSGYQMVSRIDTRTCLLDKWTNHVPVCDSLTCEPPAADGEVVVQGVPENSQGILPDRFLRFSCKTPRKYLNGSSILICGKDGKWDAPFPTCEDITCDAEEMHRYLRVTGLPRGNEKMNIGHTLYFRCTNDFGLDGKQELTCLDSGKWDGPFPTCSENCKIPDISQELTFTSDLQYNEVRKGQKLQVACRKRGTFLQGNAEVECLADGQWSHPFPTCGDPLDCGKPPGIEDGDLRDSLRFVYQHNERVEYICQKLYVFEEDSYKICKNGKWVGNVKCLRPCIVDVVDMQERNIRLKHRRQQKIYAPHRDGIEFSCTRGYPVGENLVMKRYCFDGVMQLPRCL